MTIQEWISESTRYLSKSGITTASLDAELILSHTLRRSRTWLHSHSDDQLETRHIDIADSRLELRHDRVPTAYIIGHKEFYGRLFIVTPSVLIPRPESERIIDVIGHLVYGRKARLADIGTGSGCLGITAKLENPSLDVTLIDISHHAIKVAEKNANVLGATVKTLQSDLLSKVPHVYDVIVANLPYVDRSWQTSPEVAHEPSEALYANDHGTAIIKKLLNQAPPHLVPGGCIILESDPCQHTEIIRYAQKLGYKHTGTAEYIMTFKI